MKTTLAFDVYGTLIDPQAIGRQLEALIGSRAGELARHWRDKQLEYSFRRAAMGAYEDFSRVTAQALDHACAAFEVALDEAARDALLEAYRRLDPFDDAAAALTALRDAGMQLHAFSNGRPEDLDSLMRHAGLDTALHGVVSVHEVRSFKPDPAVYAHFNRVTGCPPADTWLVSSNPFDVIGAVSCDWKAVWVQRSPAALYDPWGVEPTAVIASLAELPALVQAQA